MLQPPGTIKLVRRGDVPGKADITCQIVNHPAERLVEQFGTSK